MRRRALETVMWWCPSAPKWSWSQHKNGHLLHLNRNIIGPLRRTMMHADPTYEIVPTSSIHIVLITNEPIPSRGKTNFLVTFVG
jgi:hypothetical protein